VGGKGRNGQADSANQASYDGHYSAAKAVYKRACKGTQPLKHGNGDGTTPGLKRNKATKDYWEQQRYSR